MNEIMDAFKKTLKDKGYPLLIDSVFCNKYRAEHPNCHGCESEEGCSRYVALLGILSGSLLYPPKSYEESQQRNKIMEDKIAKILDKNSSLEEIKSVNW